MLVTEFQSHSGTIGHFKGRRNGAKAARKGFNPTLGRLGTSSPASNQLRLPCLRFNPTLGRLGTST